MLPSFLRKSRQVAWLKALLKPIDTLNADLVQFAADTRYALNFTGQVISLERLLNDQFDTTLRRIYIGDGNDTEVSIARTGSSNPPSPEQIAYRTGASAYTGENFFVFSTSQTGSNQLYNFTINIPSALVYDTGKLNALMGKYKRAGKKYKIVTF
jgi:hypothetical protein